MTGKAYEAEFDLEMKRVAVSMQLQRQLGGHAPWRMQCVRGSSMRHSPRAVPT